MTLSCYILHIIAECHMQKTDPYKRYRQDPCASQEQLHLKYLRGKYYDIKMLEARGVHHNHKKLIPYFNNLIKEALTLIY